MRTLTTAIVLPLAVLTTFITQASQYAGQESREIKALSEAEVADLLAGKGMGYAKAAELNGYPGPAHVIELSSQLGLTPDQLTRTRAIRVKMEDDAKAAGASLVAAERELDALFRSRMITDELLTEALQKIAALQARVRESHLKAHIEQARLLSDEQVATYSRLRGNGESMRRRDQDHADHEAH